MTALLIGISGGSGSGKSRLATDLAAQLGSDRVSILPFDAYYKDLRDLSMAERNQVNFDHPDSLDAEMFGHHLDGLAQGLDVALSQYSLRFREISIHAVNPSLVKGAGGLGQLHAVGGAHLLLFGLGHRHRLVWLWPPRVSFDLRSTSGPLPNRLIWQW